MRHNKAALLDRRQDECRQSKKAKPLPGENMELRKHVVALCLDKEALKVMSSTF